MNTLRKSILHVILLIKNIPPGWINKFTISTVFFFIWISFFDMHSLTDRYRLSRQVRNLEREKKTLIEGIAQSRLDKKDLENNKEKFAREKYYMHKDNEDVFIIEKK